MQNLKTELQQKDQKTSTGIEPKRKANDRKFDHFQPFLFDINFFDDCWNLNRSVWRFLTLWIFHLGVTQVRAKVVWKVGFSSSMLCLRLSMSNFF